MNSFGRKFVLTSFGESHGPAVGGVIDGCPANMVVDFDFISQQLALRNPSSVMGSTSRHEPDNVEFLSGIFEGRTLGTPIAYIIRNVAHNSNDYKNIQHIYRPGHADYTYDVKYGIRDYRGGGRASARETASRVVAGAIAQQYLLTKGISIYCFVNQIGCVSLPFDYTHYDLLRADNSLLRTPDAEIEKKMAQEINDAATSHDSIGGTVTCVIKGMKAGVGSPIFDKLQSTLAQAMLSIPAAKSFEYGLGISAASTQGSQSNDEMSFNGQKPHFTTNHAGGILGGISNGEDIYMRIAFKPVASIGITQQTITDQCTPYSVNVSGRHDTCIAPRATAVVKAMASLSIIDHLL